MDNLQEKDNSLNYEERPVEGKTQNGDIKQEQVVEEAIINEQTLAPQSEENSTTAKYKTFVLPVFEEDMPKNKGKKNKPVDNSKRKYGIISMILGIVSTEFFFASFMSLPCSIIAVIFSLISLKRGGKAFSIVGLITGIIAFGLSLFMLILAFSEGGASTPSPSSSPDSSIDNNNIANAISLISLYLKR